MKLTPKKSIPEKLTQPSPKKSSPKKPTQKRSSSRNTPEKEKGRLPKVDYQQIRLNFPFSDIGDI